MQINIPQLPVDFMNEDHAHAAAQLEAMLAALPHYDTDRAPLAEACQAFLDHNRAHFAREEAAMQASGFPPYAVHKGEHDRVLGWLEKLAADIESGLPDEAIRPRVERDLPAWLNQHIMTMDRATAAWIAAHAPASGVAV